MSNPTIKTPWAKACAGGATVAPLAPIKMSDLKTSGNGATAPALPAAGYVPPHLRNKSATGAAQEATVDLNDKSAFPTFGAPGRPTPVTGVVNKGGVAFKQAALDCLAKEAEAEANAAQAPEEDPLKMNDLELGEAGWTVLSVKPNYSTFNEHQQARERAAAAAAQAAEEAFMGSEGRDKFYDDLMNPKPTLYEQLYGVRAYYDPVNNTYGPPKDTRIYLSSSREGEDKARAALQRFRPKGRLPPIQGAPVLSV